MAEYPILHWLTEIQKVNYYSLFQIFDNKAFLKNAAVNKIRRQSFKLVFLYCTLIQSEIYPAENV